MALVATSRDLDPLIGRESLLALVRQRLRDGRMVTLTGPGGSGKTRLAQELVTERERDGDWAAFVDLSALLDSTLATSAIAIALGVLETSEHDAEASVIRWLGDRERLLVLDNLEQLKGAGHLVTRLLAAAPGLRVLATSRMPIGVVGELEVPTPPLELPSGDEPSEIGASPAVALFLARARQAGRILNLDGSTSADIANLCRRLDGLPLAIELAAARTRILSPAAILDRLDEPGTLGSAAGPDRHRSLEAVLDWSLTLLDTSERQLLCAVAVCTGGFDLGTAQAVAPDVAILSALEALARHGLVRTDGEVGREPRFRLLETVRAHALARLPAFERRDVERRHAERMLALGGEWGPAIHGVDPSLAATMIAVDLDNFRVALDWFAEADPERGLSLAGHLGPYWLSSNLLREGAERLRNSLDAASDKAADHARFVCLLASFVLSLEGPEPSRQLASQALATSRASGDEIGEAHSLNALGRAAYVGGDTAAASDYFVAAAVVADRCGDAYRATAARGSIAAMAASDGRFDEAAALFSAVISEARAHGFLSLAAISLGNLGDTYIDAAQPKRAIEPFRDALAIFRASGRARDLAWILGGLGSALAETGDEEAGRQALIEAADLALSLDSEEEAKDTLQVMLPWLSAAEEVALLGRAFGVILAIGERLGSGLPEAEGERLAARVRKGGRSALSLELAIDEGRRSDWRTVLVAIQRTLRSDQPQRPRSHDRLRHGNLTRREVEILRLVAAGRTDQEIASALFISPKTASVHVANAKAKLGAANRVDLAIRARDLGLA